MTTSRARCGSWRSPIGAEMLGAPMVFSQVRRDGEDLYWVERRPQEGGRNAIVRWRPGSGLEDVAPPGFNARTTVHEYGGGDYAVHGGTVWAARLEDQRVWRLEPGAPPRPVSALGPFRYADLVVDARRDRLLCVREDRTHSDKEPAAALVALPASGGAEAVLAQGHDFSFPRISPDGAQVAWTQWDHPAMPWNATELWLGELAGEVVAGARRLAGGSRESVTAVAWSPAGALHYASDRTGWWNLYRQEGAEAVAVHPAQADFAPPQWVFGGSHYAFAGSGRVVAAHCREGTWRLGVVEPDGRLRDLAVPYLRVADVVAEGARAWFVGSTPGTAMAVVEVDLDSGGTRVLRQAHQLGIDERYVSPPSALSFPTAGGEAAHALFHPPRNPDYEPLEGELPPLLVQVHGGPTSSSAGSAGAFHLENSYWTSRGFAVAELDYRGSTGYGRAYWEGLREAWGEADVEDAVALARHLVSEGRADPRRLLIRGESAGGYTTLMAAATSDVFAAGASYYGVAQLANFAEETHKFESRYLDWLVRPQDRERRSPLTHADRMRTPLLILQGAADRVVPPGQAEMIASALRRGGVPFALLVFEGEGHGFRRAQTLQRCAEAELYFYGRV
ncbi:MAG: prolyl oligopeptidase family serine peptidase, partial [Candidatus Dormibacterales bacterium]